jgi:hypothetical protein
VRVYSSGNPKIFHELRYGSSPSSSFSETLDKPVHSIDILSHSSNWGWQIQPVQDSTIFVNSFENEKIGLTTSFQTFPVSIDDSNVLAFDYAYAPFGNNYDTLLISFLSIETSDTTLLDNMSGTKLQTSDPTNFVFIPKANEWRTKYIDLSPWQNACISLLFTAISGNGNNLYVDNIRFENVDDSKLSFSDAYPNPTGGNPEVNINLNMPRSVSGVITLFTSVGREENRINVPAAFGPRTITIDIRSLHPGLYFVRLEAGDHSKTKKLIVN